MNIRNLFDKHIKGTVYKSHVIEVTISLCNLTLAVNKACRLETRKVHITSKIIKHLYDSKPAEEFDFLMKNLNKIVKFPDRIYVNKPGKRGLKVFVKIINELEYIASIEPDQKENEEVLYVVTAFRIRKKNYLKGYKLFWSWKGDNPSS